MSGPTRFQAPLPDQIRPPRVGRLRLGEKTARGFPKSVDYFRVEAEDSGVTSPEAAAAFHTVYGDTPRSVRIQIPAHTIEDVVDQAYRKYSAGGLQRQCEGPGGQCSQKTSTGAWRDDDCACVKAGLDPDGEPHPKDACEFNFAFSFLLPDVSGIGIWDLASGSTMSRDAIVGFLRMMLNLRGQIGLLECDMRVVMKQGRAGALVPTVELRTHEQTPRELITARAAMIDAPAVPEIPAGALDQPEPTIHQAGFTDPPAADPPAADSAGSGSPPEGEAAAGGPPTDDDDGSLGILRDNVSAQIRFLAPPVKTRLKAICERRGILPSRDGLIAAFGDDAADLAALVDRLEAEDNAADQLGLDDAEPVTGEVVT